MTLGQALDRSDRGGPREASPALDIAREVRAGSVSAADVVDRYLGAIDQIDGELHAFVTVLHDGARREAAVGRLEGGRGRRPRPAGRCARGVEGQHVHAGRAHHVLVSDPRRLVPAV